MGIRKKILKTSVKYISLLKKERSIRQKGSMEPTDGNIIIDNRMEHG